MKLIFITTCITLSLFAVSCTKKELPEKKEAVADMPVTTVNTPLAKPNPEAEKIYSKMLGSNLKFLGSLEKEVLKLLLQASAPEINQFEVLAFGFDKFNGAKTGFLQGFGCQKIAVRAEGKKYEVYSECTKPAKKLAEITEGISNKNSLTVVFLTPNWKVILGNAAGINPERTCTVTLKENKVQAFSCKDTVFSPRITGLDINLLEVKIRKYEFNRNQNDELVIEGGQYKDLIENKKINITVPISGRISIIEKELKVKDDFADMQNKLLGIEEKKQEVKDEEVSGKKENITPHTAEPEYIDAQKGENGEVSGTQEASGTAQVQSENSEEGQSQNPEENSAANPQDRDPNLSVPTTPPATQEPSQQQPQQPYGR